MRSEEDITERKSAETELVIARHALECRVKELERSNAELAAFAHNVAHDLSAPLGTVALYAQAIAQRSGDRHLDKDTQRLLSGIVKGATQARALVDDLLAYAELGANGAGCTLVSSSAVAEIALASLARAIGEAGAKIEVQPLPEVWADPSQLMRLFQNLFENAIKFRSSDRPLHVQVTADRENGEWCFRTRDNGIGIDPREADLVFEPFHRSSAGMQIPGTGIGLAICKRIVDHHDGRIWVESSPGGGSIFTFTIPNRDSDEGRPTPCPAAGRPST